MNEPVFKIAVISIEPDGYATRDYLSHFEMGRPNEFKTYPEAEAELNEQRLKAENNKAFWLPSDIREELKQDKKDLFLAIDKLYPVEL